MLQVQAVFTQGGGVDISMDHHRSGIVGNLFTEVNLGAGKRPFKSSGRGDRGAHTGVGGTFWNVHTSSGAPVQMTTCDFGPNLTFVGDFTTNYVSVKW